MCGRFVQIIDIEMFVKRFGVVQPDKINITSSFNVAPGDLAYVITNEKPNELQEMQFGLTPSARSRIVGEENGAEKETDEMELLLRG